MKKNMGLNVLVRDMPALFMADNSKFSPRLPNVIKEEIKTPSGSAFGRILILK
jgi:hypothetical protein